MWWKWRVCEVSGVEEEWEKRVRKSLLRYPKLPTGLITRSGLKARALRCCSSERPLQGTETAPIWQRVLAFGCRRDDRGRGIRFESLVTEWVTVAKGHKGTAQGGLSQVLRKNFYGNWGEKRQIFLWLWQYLVFELAPCRLSLIPSWNNIWPKGDDT